MFNMGNMMKQAQMMQERLQKAQEEIANMEVVGESGAGLVKVTVTGGHEVRRVEIDDSIFKDDKDICEDSFTYIDRYKAKGNGFHLLGVADGVHIENENSKEYGHQLLKGSERMSK